MLETINLAKNATPNHRKINGKNLTQDLQLTAADVHAVTPEILRAEIPVGVPLPWPTETPPEGWRICNGEPFDKKKYPLLALAYPSGKLPDLRGEFIRGWDDGRGIDQGRKILTEQAATSLRSAMIDYYNQDTDGAIGVVGLGFKNEDSLFDIWGSDFKMPDGSSHDSHYGSFADNGIKASVKTAIKPGVSKAITVRPRNVAFNYIVRAT